jgi:hypothetical protein
MSHPSDYLGNRRLSAQVESRHSISSGNGRPLYRLELTDVTDIEIGDRVWRRKTVSDGKKWSNLDIGSTVLFDAKLNFDRNNQVQIATSKDVDVAPADGSSWWKLW